MEEQSIIISPKTEIDRIAESFGDEAKQYFRDILVVTKIKTITATDFSKRPMNLYEATAFVIANRDLKLNPMLNHVIMLEGQLYITLDGHIQNAHNSGQLKSIIKDTEKLADVAGRPAYKVICKVIKQDGGEYQAEGYGDSKSIKGASNKTDLFFQQIAEARAVRRCLRLAFPVGMPSFEDTYDNPDFDKGAISESEKNEKAESIKDKYKKKEKIETENTTVESYIEEKQATVESHKIKPGYEGETFHTICTEYMKGHRDDHSLKGLKEWMELYDISKDRHDDIINYYNHNYVIEEESEFAKEQKEEIKAKAEIIEEKKQSEIMDKQKIAHETIVNDPQFQEAFGEDESIEKTPLLSEKQLKDKRAVLRVQYQTVVAILRNDPENKDAEARKLEKHAEIMKINDELIARGFNKD